MSRWISGHQTMPVFNKKTAKAWCYNTLKLIKERKILPIKSFLSLFGKEFLS